MTPPVLVQVIVAALLFVSWWHGALGGSRRPWARGRAFAERAGLPAEAVDAGLVRRLVRRQRFVQVGIALGAAVAYQMRGSWMVGGTVWICVYGGLAVGAVADQLTTRPAPPGTPRVAHGTRAGLTGYVPGWLVGAAVLAALAPAVLVALWFASRGPAVAGVRLAPDAAVLAVAVLPLVGLVASLALARLVVRRRQAAGSTLDLAVDDALRAQAVRDTLHLTAAVSVVAAWTLAMAFTHPLRDHDVPAGVQEVFEHVPLTVLVAVGVLLLAHEVFGGPRHWRRRLAVVG